MPWLLTSWRPNTGLPLVIARQLAGGALVAAGSTFLVTCFIRFVMEGVGTPAPVAPTRQLVVGGLYRYVRNPMYLAVLAVILGQAVLLGRLVLFSYAVVIACLFALFVYFVEQPTLRSQFGEQYEAYRRAVPAWWPRSRPWRPAADPQNDVAARSANDG